MPAKRSAGRVGSTLDLWRLPNSKETWSWWSFGPWLLQLPQRRAPYQGLAQKYADKGLVVIGVHPPEFSYERVIANVQRYVREHAIQYPVAIDNDFNTWNHYSNRYWPAMYLIDKRGIICYLRVGAGGYRQIEQLIRVLLEESSGL